MEELMATKQKVQIIEVVYNDHVEKYRREFLPSGPTWYIWTPHEPGSQQGEWYPVDSCYKEVYESIYQAGIARGQDRTRFWPKEKQGEQGEEVTDNAERQAEPHAT